jgi:putative membrane protein
VTGAVYITPGAAIVVAALVFVYAWGARRLGGKLARERKILFGWAMGALLVALGPMDVIGVGQRLFFVHMMEHFMLTMVVPPLLILGTPDWMLRPWVLSRPLRPFFNLLNKPLVAFLLFTALFVGGHDPLFLDAACHNGLVRIALHLMFIVAGLVMWWPIMSPLPEFPRLAYPYQIFYVFLLLIPMTAVAAPITLAHAVLYTWYAHGPHPLGLTPMEDQVAGGLFMWIGNGLFLMCVFSGIFFRWIQQEDGNLPGAGTPRRAQLRVVTTQPHARV